VLVKVETSVFYRITEPEKTVYRIRDVDAAIATTTTLVHDGALRMPKHSYVMVVVVL
jgi:regulator of protease activity HflC (stomatin/prohibitin superfamily)